MLRCKLKDDLTEGEKKKLRAHPDWLGSDALDEKDDILLGTTTYDGVYGD